ncbi:AraC family transcriptional regulator [Streptomyces sp. NPDC101455]|uniref:AraC family transcriptional regulator n=1 Tax=Streptomyces sp. NPDC101455 TaxID=3366142 RepID=UPI003814DF0B
MATSALLRRHTLASGNNHVELLNAISRAYHIRVTPLGPPTPHAVYEFRAIQEPQFTIGFISSDVGARTERFDGAYYLNLTVAGDVRAERGDERIVNDARVAVVFNTGDRQTLVPGADGVEQVGIRLSHELVEKELTALLGRPPEGPVRFDFALDLGEPRSSGMRLVIDAALRQWSSEDSLFDHPAVQLAQVRSLVTGLLLAHGHNFSEALHSGQEPMRPRGLRRALDFIESRLDEHLTLADIATAAGYSARTVTEAFGRHMGVTPMTYVRNERLQRAREELLAGGDSVSTVATRWGFHHLGRFALSYHRRFGELPSETLGRC